MNAFEGTMSNRLANKVGIITGTSGSIGQAAAVAFVREGATDIVVDGGLCASAPMEVEAANPAEAEKVAYERQRREEFRQQRRHMPLPGRHRDREPDKAAGSID